MVEQKLDPLPVENLEAWTHSIGLADLEQSTDQGVVAHLRPLIAFSVAHSKQLATRGYETTLAAIRYETSGLGGLEAQHRVGRESAKDGPG